MRILAALILSAVSMFSIDLNRYASSTIVNVNNTNNAPVLCPLEGARMVQVYIRASSTAQAYNVTLNDGSIVEVPSGGYFTLQITDGINASQQVFRVQTSTSSAVLQVLAFRNTR